MPQAIGIDLGTTFSCVAYMKSDSKVEVVENHYGNKITPSVVHFGSMFREVGEEAQAKRGADPLNTVFQIKRFMGRSANDAEITKRPYPFEILSTRKGDVAIRVTPSDEDATGESKTICPEQISSYILRYMMVLAQDKIGSEVKNAVITVPANFNNAQRQATKDAGEMAGLNVLRIINEPTAAALAYGFGLNSDDKRLTLIVLVYDLGGGTFDVSIVRSHGLGGEVLSTAGVTDLGGEDFDRRLFEHVTNDFKQRGLTVTLGEEFGLYQSCERAKMTLSVCDRASIELFRNGKKHACEITRQLFEELCIELFEKTIECVEDAIVEAKVDKDSIDDIVLVGGSSRIPMVQQMVREFFGDKELKFNIPPDHAVAFGDATLAESLSSNKNKERSSIRGSVTLADVLPYSLGTNITCDRFSVLLRRNTQYPTSAKDNVNQMTFKILEGENACHSENKLLGVCRISVPPRKIDENHILTTFSVDENGILSVHLRDKDTEEEASTKVQTSKLTDEERMAMVRNAKKEEESEQIQRAKYEARTFLANVMSNVRRSVHKTDSKIKIENLEKLIEQEEKWIASQLTLRTFFNSLQARTLHKLSPETRLFAEVCYEKKLVGYVECANSDEGKDKIKEISMRSESENLRRTWKPLVDHCSQLLRTLKLETTNARLSRLSDHWSKSEEGSKQQGRVMEVLQNVIHYSLKQANSICEDILNWIELYSIPHSTIIETVRVKRDEVLRVFKRNIMVVDQTETFSEAVAFLNEEVGRDSRIHVIVGNDDDAAQFYKTIYERFTRYGKYGMLLSPKIVIGSRYYFSRDSEKNSRTMISAVILHAERNMEESIETRFEKGNLDDFIAEIFTLVTITMKHYDEINEIVNYSSLLNLGDIVNSIRSWPTENQIFNMDRIKEIWNKCYLINSNSWNRTRFIEYLRSLTQNSLDAKRKQFKVAHNLRGYVDQHVFKFVQSAIVARAAELGQDYIVYAERSSSYTRVLIIHRSNPFREPPKYLNISNTVMRQGNTKPKPMSSQSSIDNFPTFVSTASKVLNDHLIIVIYPTNGILNNTVKHLRDIGENVCFCETSGGVLTESRKNPTGTLVGWKFIPRTREILRILVCHHKMDRSALEIACDLASPSDIESITVPTDDLDRMKTLNVGREPGRAWWRNKIDLPYSAIQMFSDGCSSEPEMLIEKYSKDGNINDLLQAKRTLHRRLRHLSETAKIANSRLPAKILESVDSPMDISSHGFVEKSRFRIEEIITKLREVDRKLSNHGMVHGLGKAKKYEDALEAISNLYMVPVNDLVSFVRGIRMSNKPVEWNDVRAKIAKRFKLEYDAENHWLMCFSDQKPSDRRMVALSSECVANATTFLHDLRLTKLPDNYLQSLIQCSDRSLDDCTMYYPEAGLDEDGLLEIDGVSIEYTALAYSTKKLPNIFPNSILDKVVVESADKQCPLYLLPRRCYDRLTRFLEDLFDSGIIICRDYESAEKQMNPFDTIQLPIILESNRPSFLERLLKAESSLMEYGSYEWMKWMARRLRYFDYHPEAVGFYHRAVAERDYCVQDERLIKRLRDALTASSLEISSSLDQMRVDAFIYNTMDILQRGERLVLIDPQFASNEALFQLTHFIRSRRMPPSVPHTEVVSPSNQVL